MKIFEFKNWSLEDDQLAYVNKHKLFRIKIGAGTSDQIRVYRELKGTHLYVVSRNDKLDYVGIEKIKIMGELVSECFFQSASEHIEGWQEKRHTLLLRILINCLGDD